MIKKILTFAAIAISATSFAQLKVTTGGKVGIGTFMPQEQLQIGDRWTFTNYASKSINYNTFWNGSIARLTDDFCSSIRFNNDGSIQFDAAPFGVAGSSAVLSQTLRINNNGNVAIGSSSPLYKLDVSGAVRATQYLTLSDKKFKMDISNIESPLDKILKLNGVTYFLKIDDLKLDNNQRKNYGFIAQDLQKIIPDIVYSDSNGTLSVDYLAIIPYLVEAIKKQNLEIIELKEVLNPNKQKESIFSNSNSLIVDECKLYQNNPNPFNSTTQIKALILDKVKSATLYIYDMNGSQQKSINISERGTVITEISASSLKAGLYYYTLVCDGQEVNTKKMIITE
jgi:hypothetical protein